MFTNQISNNAFEIRRDDKSRISGRFYNFRTRLQKKINKNGNIKLVEEKNTKIKKSATSSEASEGFENPMLNESSTKTFLNLETKSIRSIKAEKKLHKISNKLQPQNACNNLSINPYEVQRVPKNKIKKTKQFNEDNYVFFNAALDIHCQKPTLKTVDGDFEVIRSTGKLRISKDDESGCFENPALEIPSTAIVVPFVPNIGLRVKFETLSTNIPEMQTSKPALEDLLNTAQDKSTFSIDQELEYYENQLENSINETKNARSIKGRENVTPKSLRKIKAGKVTTPSKQQLRKSTILSVAKQLNYIKQTTV